MNKYTQFLTGGEVKRIRMKARVTPELIQILSSITCTQKDISHYLDKNYVYLSIDSNDLLWTPHDRRSLVPSILPAYYLISQEAITVLILLNTFEAMEIYLNSLE